jgi:hypothetical protein
MLEKTTRHHPFCAQAVASHRVKGLVAMLVVEMVLLVVVVVVVVAVVLVVVAVLVAVAVVSEKTW